MMQLQRFKVYVYLARFAIRVERDALLRSYGVHQARSTTKGIYLVSLDVLCERRVFTRRRTARPVVFARVMSRRHARRRPVRVGHIQASDAVCFTRVVASRESLLHARRCLRRVDIPYLDAQMRKNDCISVGVPSDEISARAIIQAKYQFCFCCGLDHAD